MAREDVASEVASTPAQPERETENVERSDIKVRVLERINNLARTDQDRAIERYGGLKPFSLLSRVCKRVGLGGFGARLDKSDDSISKSYGRIRAWFDQAGKWSSREPSENIDDDLRKAGIYTENGDWKKALKIGAKVFGGFGAAATAVFSGVGVFTPLVWGVGLKEGYDGLLQAAEHFGWGKNRAAAEVAKQQAVGEVVTRMRQEALDGTLTEEKFSRYQLEISQAERQAVEQITENVYGKTGEERFKKIRSVATSVLTFATGIFAGVPLGPSNYDQNNTDLATAFAKIDPNNPVMSDTHRVFWNLKDKGQFAYDQMPNGQDELKWLQGVIKRVNEIGKSGTFNTLDGESLKSLYGQAGHLLDARMPKALLAGLGTAEKLKLGGVFAYLLGESASHFFGKKKEFGVSGNVPTGTVEGGRGRVEGRGERVEGTPQAQEASALEGQSTPTPPTPGPEPEGAPTPSPKSEGEPSPVEAAGDKEDAAEYESERREERIDPYDTTGERRQERGKEGQSAFLFEQVRGNQQILIAVNSHAEHLGLTQDRLQEIAQDLAGAYDSLSTINEKKMWETLRSLCFDFQNSILKPEGLDASVSWTMVITLHGGRFFAFKFNNDKSYLYLPDRSDVLVAEKSDSGEGWNSSFGVLNQNERIVLVNESLDNINEGRRKEIVGADDLTSNEKIEQLMLEGQEIGGDELLAVITEYHPEEPKTETKKGKAIEVETPEGFTDMGSFSPISYDESDRKSKKDPRFQEALGEMRQGRRIIIRLTEGWWEFIPMHNSRGDLISESTRKTKAYSAEEDDDIAFEEVSYAIKRLGEDLAPIEGPGVNRRSAVHSELVGYHWYLGQEAEVVSETDAKMLAAAQQLRDAGKTILAEMVFESKHKAVLVVEYDGAEFRLPVNALVLASGENVELDEDKSSPGKKPFRITRAMGNIDRPGTLLGVDIRFVMFSTGLDAASELKESGDVVGAKVIDSDGEPAIELSHHGKDFVFVINSARDKDGRGIPLKTRRNEFENKTFKVKILEAIESDKEPGKLFRVDVEIGAETEAGPTISDELRIARDLASANEVIHAKIIDSAGEPAIEFRLASGKTHVFIVNAATNSKGEGIHVKGERAKFENKRFNIRITDALEDRDHPGQLFRVNVEVGDEIEPGISEDLRVAREMAGAGDTIEAMIIDLGGYPAAVVEHEGARHTFVINAATNESGERIRFRGKRDKYENKTFKIKITEALEDRDNAGQLYRVNVEINETGAERKIDLSGYNFEDKGPIAGRGLFDFLDAVDRFTVGADEPVLAEREGIKALVTVITRSRDGRPNGFRYRLVDNDLSMTEERESDDMKLLIAPHGRSTWYLGHRKESGDPTPTGPEKRVELESKGLDFRGAVADDLNIFIENSNENLGGTPHGIYVEHEGQIYLVSFVAADRREASLYPVDDALQPNAAEVLVAVDKLEDAAEGYFWYYEKEEYSERDFKVASRLLQSGETISVRVMPSSVDGGKTISFDYDEQTREFDLDSDYEPQKELVESFEIGKEYNIRIVKVNRGKESLERWNVESVGVVLDSSDPGTTDAEFIDHLSGGKITVKPIAIERGSDIVAGIQIGSREFCMNEEYLRRNDTLAERLSGAFQADETIDVRITDTSAGDVPGSVESLSIELAFETPEGFMSKGTLTRGSKKDFVEAVRIALENARNPRVIIRSEKTGFNWEVIGIDSSKIRRIVVDDSFERPGKVYSDEVVIGDLVTSGSFEWFIEESKPADPGAQGNVDLKREADEGESRDKPDIIFATELVGQDYFPAIIKKRTIKGAAKWFIVHMESDREFAVEMSNQELAEDLEDRGHNRICQAKVVGVNPNSRGGLSSVTIEVRDFVIAKEEQGEEGTGV